MALMGTFSELAYKHLKEIKLWKTRAKDQGVKSICEFMEKGKNVQKLVLVENEITPLGCDFLGASLSPV